MHRTAIFLPDSSKDYVFLSTTSTMPIVIRRGIASQIKEFRSFLNETSN